MLRLQAIMKHVQQANTKAAMDMAFDNIIIVQTSAFHSQLQIFDKLRSTPLIHEKGVSLRYSIMALMFYTNTFRVVVVIGGALGSIVTGPPSSREPLACGGPRREPCRHSGKGLCGVKVVMPAEMSKAVKGWVLQKRCWRL